LSTSGFGEQWTRIAILAIASCLLSARFVNGERSPILVDLTHAFPVSVGDAVAYITDTRNWKAFLPNFVRLHDPTRIKRDTLVDKVTVVIRLPSRDVQVSTMLGKYEQDSRVPDVSRQKGLPDAKHERHFKAVPEGFAFRPVGVFETRSGLAALVERFVERAAPGAVRKSMEGLEVDFGQQRSRA
jgi:hypothetical protein